MLKNLRTRTISTLFFISGAAALIYQVVWFKYLSLFIGNSTYAQSIVLATFMAGLALGSYIFGKKSDNIKSPLLLFAILEIIVGIYCFFFPFIIELVKTFYFSTTHFFELPDNTFGLFFKLMAGVLSIFFPSILLGGTFPVLVKSIIQDVKDAGQKIGFLYYVNSFGAVTGCFLAGFLLLQFVGLQNSIFIAGIADIGIGIYVLYKMKSLNFSAVSSTLFTKIVPAEKIGFFSKKIMSPIIVAFFSGIAAMIFEVTWVRLLIPVLGSTTYSFTLMLITFIGGITIGSYLFSKIYFRIRNLPLFILFTQAGIATFMFITLPLYSRIPYYLLSIANLLPREEVYFPLYLFLQFIMCFCIIVIPTVLMGLSLPAIIKLAVTDIKDLGKTTGFIYSVNTTGTVVGALAAGLLLIPLIGIKNTIETGIFISIAAAILVVYKYKLFKNTVTYLSFSILFLSGIFYFVFNSEWNYSIMLSEVPRMINSNKKTPENYQSFLKQISPDELLFYKEGPSATIAVTKVKEQIILFTNGKGDSNTKKDMPTQVLLGQIPLLLHAAPDTVMIIGFGSGATAGSVLTHPVKYVESAEISPEVFEASVFFNGSNNRPLEDKRLKLFSDDGLSAVKASGKKYDVIISQPSNPYTAGVGNLFTVEFFKECKKKLKKDGIIAQWFNLYEMDDKTLKMVIRTFSEIFPDFSIWHVNNSNIVIIGSIMPIEYDFPKMLERFQQDKVNGDMKKIQIPDLPTFLSLQMTGGNSLKIYAGEGPVNTENHPYLEHWAPKAFFVNKGAIEFYKLDERLDFNNSGLALKNYLDNTILSDEEALNIALFHATTNRGNSELGYLRLKKYLDKHPDDIPASTAMVTLLESVNRIEESKLYQKKLSSIVITDSAGIDAIVNRGIAKARNNDVSGALEDFNKAIEIDPEFEPALQNKAFALMHFQDFAGAITIYTKLISLDSTNPTYSYFRGYSNASMRQYQSAIADYKRAVVLNPVYPAAFFGLGYALSETGNISEAIKNYDKAIEYQPNYADAFFNRGFLKLKSGDKNNGCNDIAVAAGLKDQRAINYYNNNCKN